jgi:putative hemolysin
LTVLLRDPGNTYGVIARIADHPALDLGPVPAPVSEFHSFIATSIEPTEKLRPQIHAEVGQYCLRMAQSAEDREAACRLRFKVFNIELGEGLESSYETGLDSDQFDLFCEHLLVEEKATRRIVGTYRMQTGESAARNLGYYSGQEFHLAPYEPLRAGILELGRASIDREHRTPEVLTLLWRGIAQYATDMGLRYLIGCSSLNSQDPAEGWQMYQQLEHYRVAREFETTPTDQYACPTEHVSRCAQQPAGQEGNSLQTDSANTVKVPKLLKTYLAIGARIAAPPAWDREFGTIDFLTLLDLKSLSSAARHRFLAPLTQ